MSLPSTNRLKNYRVFIVAGACIAFAVGLFGPFWIIFIKDFGGSLQNFGFAFGIMLLAKSATSYFVGRLSDRIGRKIILVIAAFITSGLIVAYTLIDTLVQLYILQMFFGAMNAVNDTMKLAFLGDLTEKTSRGADMGRFEAITVFVGALAMMAGGFFAEKFGIVFIFYVVAGFFVLSGFLLLFYIKEEKH